MKKINLLPWREQDRIDRKNQFFAALLASVILTILILFPVYLIINTMVASQRARNVFLEEEIAHVDKKIMEIRNLKKQKAQLIARMNIIQQLQADRFISAQLYETMIKVLPDNVYIEKIERSHEQITILGVSDSNASVSNLMRNLENSKYLYKPELREINTEDVDGVLMRHFKLVVYQLLPHGQSGQIQGAM